MSTSNQTLTDFVELAFDLAADVGPEDEGWPQELAGCKTDVEPRGKAASLVIVTLRDGSKFRVSISKMA